MIVSGERTLAGAGFGLEAFRFDAANVAGFPRPTANLGPLASNSPAVADLDGDGLLEMAWFDMDGRLFVWNLPALSTGAAPWPMFRADAGHTGRATATPTGTIGVVENPGGPYSGFKRQPIVFDGSASVSGGGVLDRYHWGFGDGACGPARRSRNAYQTSGVFALTLVVGRGTRLLGSGDHDRHRRQSPADRESGPPRSGTNTVRLVRHERLARSRPRSADVLVELATGQREAEPSSHQYVAGVYVAT